MEKKTNIPLIVAHRGAHKATSLEENTLEAFAQAFTYNVDAIEGDFHLTSDKYIVCHHDPILHGYAIKEQPLEKLRKLKYNLPTLDEVLALIPSDKMIFIEIKCGIEIFEYLASILSNAPLKQSQIVIISFDAEVVHQAKVTYPNMAVYLLHEFEENDVPSFKELKKRLELTQADGLGTNITKHIDHHFIQEIQNAGYSYHVWTYKTYKIDSTEKIEQLKAWKVASITLDAIDLF